MWEDTVYIMTYLLLSIVMLSAPIVVFLLSLYMVICYRSPSKVKVVITCNVVLFVAISLNLLVIGNGTVTANAIFGYTVVGIFLACTGVAYVWLWVDSQLRTILAGVSRRRVQEAEV